MDDKNKNLLKPEEKRVINSSQNLALPPKKRSKLEEISASQDFAGNANNDDLFQNNWHGRSYMPSNNGNYLREG